MTAPKNTTEPDDPFSTSRRGAYPKPEDLDGSLLLLTPIKVENIPNRPEYVAKGAPERVDRASVDTVVFGPDGVEEYDEMFWSQAAIVNACKKELKPNAKGMQLGVLVKVATAAARDKLKIGDTPEDYAKAYRAWKENPKSRDSDRPGFVYILAEPDEAQIQRAREYLAERAAAARAREAAKAPESNPFATGD